MTKTKIAVTYNPFKASHIQKVIAATEAQKELWTSCIIGGIDANIAYNESLSLLLKGDLHSDSLKKAIQILIIRNESLRSVFNADGTQMIIYDFLEPIIYYQNLMSLDLAGQNSFLNDFHKRDAVNVFDLLNGPLIRFSLFKIAHNEHLLSITAHHIICDGWSFGVLLEELSGIYNSIKNQEDLPNATLSFAAYVKKMHTQPLRDIIISAENYWVNEFRQQVPELSLQTDFQRPSVRTYKADRYDYIMSLEVAERVKKVGAKFSCSFVNILLFSFEILLHKITGQNEIVIGLPTAGQSATEMYNLIGHCVNTLPIKTIIDDETEFAVYMQMRKSKMLQDLEHQLFTFGALLQKLNIKRYPDRIPLIPIVFNVDIGMDMNVQFQDLDYEIIYNKRLGETFEIYLNITQDKKGYIFQWSYNTDLFSAYTIQKLMDDYLHILEQIITYPREKISKIHLSDTNSIFSQLSIWNSTEKLLPDENIISLFDQSVQRYPTHTALQYNSLSYTYGEINTLANKFANYLLSHGVKPASLTGVMLERGPAMLISLLAVLKIRSAYLPIDPSLPAERIDYMLANGKVAYVIINKPQSHTITSHIHVIVYDDFDSVQKELPFENATNCIKNDDLAYVIYTSGSTGKPKGVMVNHENLLNLLLYTRDTFQTSEHTRALSVTTLSFDILAVELYLPLISGGTVILADEATVKDGQRLVKKMANEKINFLQATPATYKMMLHAGWKNIVPGILISCGEALPKDLAEKLIKRCEVLYNMYGPTETTIFSTGTRINPEDKIITIGKPIYNTQVYILDKNQNLSAEGSSGEIYIGGKGLSHGYYNNFHLTDEKFIINPFDDSKKTKLYKTGDRGKFLPDGNILYLGRLDFQVKIRGYRIELNEIEHYLLLLQDIKDVIILPVELHGDTTLTACIIPEHPTDGNQFTKDEILNFRAQLKKFLPSYMMPEYWVKLNQFPLSANSKIDRRALSNTALSIIKSVSHSEEDSEFINIIGKIWEEELGIQNVTAEDDFFQLGGHSMIAIRVIDKIKNVTGKDLPLSLLFEYTTLQSLTNALQNNVKKQDDEIIIPLRSSGSRPPVFLIHAGALNILMYKSLIQFFDKDQPVYGIKGLGLDGDLTDLESIQSIAQRYITEICKIQPKGPYMIIGYSLGGMIGWEIAKQLLSIGETVAMLGILDTNAFTGDKHTNKYQKLFYKSIRQFKKIFFFTKTFYRYPKDTIHYQRLVFNRIFNKNFRDPDDQQVYDFDKEILEAYDNAYNNYVLTPLPLKVDLFKVAKRIYYVDDTRYLGWQKYAKGGVNVHIVPGDHRTFILPPNNKVLAKELQQTISERIAQLFIEINKNT